MLDKNHRMLQILLLFGHGYWPYLGSTISTAHALAHIQVMVVMSLNLENTAYTVWAPSSVLQWRKSCNACGVSWYMYVHVHACGSKSYKLDSLLYCSLWSLTTLSRGEHYMWLSTTKPTIICWASIWDTLYKPKKATYGDFHFLVWTNRAIILLHKYLFRF